MTIETPISVCDVMTANPVVVDAEATLDEVLAILGNYGFRHLPVVECDLLVGILSDRDVRLATGLLPADARLTADHGRRVEGARNVRDIMRTNVRYADPDEPASEVARRMVRERIGALPVISEEKVVGIVTETDLMEAFCELCRQRSGACDDLVRYHLHELDDDVQPDVSVEEALGRMNMLVRHLLVYAGGRVVGILSDRDLLVGLSRSMLNDARAQESGRMGADSMRVEQVMSRRVVSIEPGETLGRATRTMLGHGISALPVIDAGSSAPLGILTQRDVLGYYALVARDSADSKAATDGTADGALGEAAGADADERSQ